MRKRTDAQRERERGGGREREIVTREKRIE